MKNSKSLYLFSLVFVLAALLFTFSAISVSAEDTSGEPIVIDEGDGIDVDVSTLVTFDGYSARKVSYNGLRSQYTLDLKALADLEKDYDIEIGMLMATTGEDSEDSYNSLTVDNYASKSVFYTTEEQYLGKYYGSLDSSSIEFVYSITFPSKSQETKKNFETQLMYRVYVTVTDENGEANTLYVNNISEAFGYAVSLKDIAQYCVGTVDHNYPMLQRVIAICNGNSLSPFELLETDIDRFSIVINTADDLPFANSLNLALKIYTGYTLPVVVGSAPETAAYYDDAYIYINTSSADVTEVGSYYITSETGKATINMSGTSVAEDAVGDFVARLVENSYLPFGTVYVKSSWTDPIK